MEKMTEMIFRKPTGTAVAYVNVAVVIVLVELLHLEIPLAFATEIV